MVMKKQLKTITCINILFLFILIPIISSGDQLKLTSSHQERLTNIQPIDIKEKMQRFIFHSGLNFDYPDAVRGIYLTGHSAGGSRFENLVDLVQNSDLNAMVIDIK